MTHILRSTATWFFLHELLRDHKTVIFWDYFLGDVHFSFDQNRSHQLGTWYNKYRLSTTHVNWGFMHWVPIPCTIYYLGSLNVSKWQFLAHFYGIKSYQKLFLRTTYKLGKSLCYSVWNLRIMKYCL